MKPFDPPRSSGEDIEEIKALRETATALSDVKNKTGSISPDALGPEELPPCWQLAPGEPNTTLYIYGPKAAVFDAPPPANPAPAEPDEEIGTALTPRQLAFCERYVECPVAARAAREAGYTESTAATQASRLLKHPLVMRRVLELRRKRHLEEAYRRETLLDKFEAVFSEAIERKEFYAAIQALTMQARLAGLTEAQPGLRYVRQAKTAGEQVIWDAVNRLEQKLSEITVGDYPGAAATMPLPRK